MPKTEQPLTQLEFDQADFPKAEAIAEAMGYEPTAYTSSSALWGLFCANGGRTACVIKTRELGFVLVQTGEDAGFGLDWSEV